MASGFEHSVANMYFIPMGLALKGQPDVLAAAQGMAGQSIILGNLTVAGFLVKNLIPVTLGNIVGGSLLVGASTGQCTSDSSPFETCFGLLKWASGSSFFLIPGSLLHHG